MASEAPQLAFRRARNNDFQFCWSLYRDLMMPLTTELLEWNESGQRRVIEQSLTDSGTFIIVVRGSDIGWLQTRETPEEIYLGQLYVVPSMQSRGIGSAIVRQLCDRAHREGKALTLDVMKNNRAHFFYERFGFRTIGTSKYKYKMRWELRDSPRADGAGEANTNPAIDHEENVRRVLCAVTAWAQRCDNIRGIALVGSRARDAARADSDIDLVLLVPDPRKFFSDDTWLQAIDWSSRPVHYQDAQYGACTSRHVRLENTLEVEFGFVPLSWANCSPVDSGTKQVIAGGCRVLYDRDKAITNLLAHCFGSVADNDLRN
jgi:ribosomal protein S18 acetylase RimI-like enzyme